MSNIISKIRQRIALREKNKFNLTSDHITTTDFFKLSPVYFKEMVPGESITIKQSTFTRLSPLINPMYGRCRIENRAFFVPMRTIMKGWNEFITDTPLNGSYQIVPWINPKDLAVCLVSLSEAGTQTTYDYSITSGTSTSYKKFTAEGRAAWQILCSLGYKFPIGYYASNDVTVVADDEKFSALPLLAFFKVFYDWYKAQGYDDPNFYSIFEMGDSNSVQSLANPKLKALFQKVISATYDKDYFTSAWDRPVAPNSGVNSNVTIPDASNDCPTSGAYSNSYVTTSNPATSAIPSTPSVRGITGTGGSVQGSPANITQYILDALKSLTDYTKRHQLAGSQAMDRMLARFGMKPSDAALRRSIYLGKNTVNVQIADVMATANGATGTGQSLRQSNVGDYAGKGVGFDGGSFHYETNEYGYIMVLSTLVPAVGYVQGVSRYTLHRDKLDFFTPEFDSLGVQAIARKELLSDYNTQTADNNLKSLTAAAALNGVFGYTSRYAEYKTSQDFLSGDFCVNSRNTGLEPWHLNRMFDADTVTLNDDLTHSLDFVSATDCEQYDRVFALTPNSYDHFINIHHFEIEDYAPMAKLFDDYQFDGGKKEVSIEINGTQLN